MKTLDVLGKYILTEIAVDCDQESLEADADLLGSGIVDSMAVLKLVLFFEETFGIEVKDEDLVPENFQTLNSMVHYIEQKVRGK